MIHWEKVAFYFGDRRYNQGIFGAWSNRVPLRYRISRWFGIKARPFVFCSFPIVALINGGCFGVLFGAMQRVPWLQSAHYPLIETALSAFVGGMTFGCIGAYQIHRKAKRLNLPNWVDYPDPDAEVVTAMIETMEIRANPAAMAAIAEAEANKGRKYWLEDLPD